MVRVFVTVDIEGIAGVVDSEEGQKGNPEYERARRLMTSEASAVVAGIFDADPSARVTVADVHGPFRNIIPEELDERATLLRGKPRLLGMVDGVDRGYDRAMFVGVHGRAGAGSSVLSHTFTGTLLDVQVNGRSMGELGLNAAVCGHFGVPVVLVAGDQVVAREARELLGERVVTVIVKESRGQMTAEAPHPRVACGTLREAAAMALRERGDVPPLVVPGPVEVQVSLARPVFADRAEMIERVERVDGRTVRYTRPDMLAAYRIVRLIAELSRLP